MKSLHWKVVTALAAVGVGLFALVPGLVAGVVPLLVLAACPLSMLLMIGAMCSMGGAKRSDNSTDPSTAAVAALGAEIAHLRTRRAAAGNDESSGTG